MNKNKKSKQLLNLLIKEILDINNEGQYQEVEDMDMSSPTSSSSIVTNPPQNIDTIDSSLDKEQDATDDAEQMSISQIANAIEDTVETEVNSDTTGDKPQ